MRTVPIQDRRRRAALLLGGMLAMIPGRWAAAAVTAPVAISPPQEVEPPPPLIDPVLRDVPSVVEAERLVWKGGPDFYNAIRRDDLAASYHSRFALKLTSRVVGATALVAGSLVAAAANFGCDPLLGPPDTPGCYDKKWGAIGGLMMLGGLAAIIVPSCFDTDPANPHERSELLGDFARREKARRLSFAPRVDRDGAELTLSGRF
jgi:hypothetical protein